MKNKSTFLLVIILSAIALAGCGHREKQQPPPLEMVHAKRVHHPASSGSDDGWLYFYWFQDSVTRNFYYFDSTEPMSSSLFTSANWQRSATAPKELEELESETLPDEPVATEDLGAAAAELQSDFASIPAENSLDSMEGVPDSSVASDTSSDSGSGGDSGGGDSGGGGE
jgi:uncharacterized membrane protein YgcG